MQTLHNPMTDVTWSEYFLDEEQFSARKKMDQRAQEMAPKGFTVVKRRKIGRNDPCPCGSGNKFKKCCISSAR